MVRAAKCRVVSVVGRDDDEVFGPNSGEEIPEPVVELFQRFAVSRYISSMAVKHVEVDQVHENEAVMLCDHNFEICAMPSSFEAVG